MRVSLTLLLALATALPSLAQSYSPSVQTGLPHDPADRASHDCTTNPLNILSNCSFESGDFTDWIAEDIAMPFYPLEVNGAGVSLGFGFFTSAPTNGALATLTGFDGDGPGVIRLSQDLVVPPGISLMLLFDYRAAWDLFNFGNPLEDRVFRVNVEPVGGGTPLDTFTILVAEAGTVVLDTGDLEGMVDLSSYTNSSFRLVFEWEIPEFFTGPAFFQLDNVDVELIIPVELTAFEATVDGSAVNLAWATASETNNAGFEVQVQNGEGWDAMAWVEGHGTTTEAQTYGYTAGDMAVGTHSFRLKQIDFDGAFEYSDELEVTVETPGTHLMTSAYPNPFNPQSQFTLAVAQEQRVTVELYSTLGRRVAVLFSGTVEANQAQLLTIDGAGLASGMYIVRVTGERFADALRVTLLK